MKTGDDVYEFISRIRISESCESLKIDIDAMQRYFFWHTMNESLQQNFIHITNETKPTLEKIRTHIFEAPERYADTSHHPKNCTIYPQPNDKGALLKHLQDV